MKTDHMKTDPLDRTTCVTDYDMSGTDTKTGMDANHGKDANQSARGSYLIAGDSTRSADEVENEGVLGGLMILAVIIFGAIEVTKMVWNMSPFAVVAWAMIVGAIVLAGYSACLQWWR